MGKPLEIRQGSKYGRLTIIREVEPKIAFYNNYYRNYRKVYCICDCGGTWTGLISHLMTNRVKSCGCYNREKQTERIIKKNLVHGLCIKRKHYLYETWTGMKKRCYNPNSINYKYYGARGIKVCDRWLNSFKNFYDDMGDRPTGFSIDRINPNGNYEPSNCRWSDSKTQNRNKRK